MCSSPSGIYLRGQDQDGKDLNRTSAVGMLNYGVMNTLNNQSIDSGFGVWRNCEVRNESCYLEGGPTLWLIWRRLEEISRSYRNFYDTPMHHLPKASSSECSVPLNVGDLLALLQSFYIFFMRPAFSYPHYWLSGRWRKNVWLSRWCQ